MPTTEIIAAMPIAMPSADRKTRSGRARRPAAPTRSTSAGRSRAAASSRVVIAARQRLSRATIAPSRISTWRGSPAAISRSWVMTTTVVPARVELAAAGPSRRRPEAESRLPVGSSASSSAGSPTTARAIATRCFSPPDSSCGRWSSRWPGRPGPAPRSARRRRSAQRHARRRAARRPRCPAPARRPPGGTAGTRTRSAGPAAPRAAGRTASATSYPSMWTVPLVGRSSVPIRLSMVDLPEPDGPTIATSSPVPTRSDAVPDRDHAGVDLADPVQLRRPRSRRQPHRQCPRPARSPLTSTRPPANSPVLTAT